MAHDVFISYSDKDRLTVSGICAFLEQNGIRCFVAYRDIPVGIVWAGAITDAIENCKIMLIIYSGHFNQSDQVDREIELCSNLKRPILTFKLSQIPYNKVKQYYLQNINWIDAFPEPEKYFDKLTESIKLLINCDHVFDKSNKSIDSSDNKLIKVEEWNRPSSKIGKLFKSFFTDK
jgi:hypothetical protein